MAGRYGILIVDDEPLVRATLAEAVFEWGYEPLEASDVESALTVFEARSPAVVLLDVNLPDGSGLDFLAEIKQRQSRTVVIVVAGDMMLDNTLKALRGGAFDFICTPINVAELRTALHNGLDARDLRRAVSQFARERARLFGFDTIVGDSAPMRDVVMLARKVAACDTASVLLLGEPGTGKDVITKAIHYTSVRAERPFVAINCAAIPANLIESELYGYEKGAFTDAKTRKEGLFEQAEGGTLFLDEIGDLDVRHQSKLLRVLEEGAFRRVGGFKDLPLDVRVVAASSRDLQAKSVGGSFRRDLYYRLAVIQIEVPPLRARGDDALLLAEHFIRELGGRRCLTPDAVAALRAYPWPGNVRELRNVIERALVLEEGDAITDRYLPIAVPESPPAAVTERDCVIEWMREKGFSLEELEISLVEKALATCAGNQTRAASLLGISRDQLRYRLKKIEERAAAERN